MNTRVLVVATVLVASIAGCGQPRPASTAAPSAPATVVEDPPVMSGMTSLAVLSSRTGTTTTTVPVPAGSLWIVVSCTGGTLTVDVKDLDTQPYTCGNSGPGLFDAQIDLPAAQDVTVAVQPDSPAVRWSVRVGNGA